MLILAPLSLAIPTRAGKSKSLIRWKRQKKADLVMQLAFWQKLCQKELQGTGSLITPERKVPQRSDASQNDHKSKGYPSKTSEAAFTIQKADKGG